MPDVNAYVLLTKTVVAIFTTEMLHRKTGKFVGNYKGL